MVDGGVRTVIAVLSLRRVRVRAAPQKNGFGICSNAVANDCAEAAFILENTRLAGHSYKRWVLKDYMALLRVRSLLARGRARAGPETPEVAKRLFDGVPDPVFWKVMEYYRLGDWRRP